MLAGSIFYVAFIGQFWHPNGPLLYASSVALGMGAAILWTAQGVFLAVNSESATIGRNSGLFWAMFQSSQLLGNAFVFFEMRGKDDFGQSERHLIVGVLLVVCAIGASLFLAMRPTPWVLHQREDQQPADTPVSAFKRSWQLLWTPRMLLLCLTFAYSGLELTFISGVYGACLGFTRSFGSAAKR